jgi:hypothetical protein
MSGIVRLVRNGLLMAVLMLIVLVAGTGQLYLEYVGIEDWLGSGWALGALALAFFARIMVPLTIGTFMAVTNVYGFEWWVGAAAAAPGLFLIVPAMVTETIMRAFATTEMPRLKTVNNGRDLKPQVSEATRTPLRNLNVKNVGDLIKNYKGFSVYKQEFGVSVGKQNFKNVIEAEKWIDGEIIRLNDEKKKREEAFDLVQISDNAITKDNDAYTNNEKADSFLLETLQLYKDGKLSEAAMLEIIANKQS